MNSCKTLIKTLMISVLAVIMVAVPAVFAAETPAADSVASVNGVQISRVRFDQELQRASRSFGRPGQEVPESMQQMLRDRVVDYLIGEELLYQDAVKKGITITDEQIDQEVTKMIANFGTEEKYKEALAGMNVTEEKVRHDIRRGLSIQQLIQRDVASKITVSDEEIKKFFDENQKLFSKPAQVQASHILIKVSKDADEAAKAEARTKIDKAAQRVKDGEDFAAVAKDVSEGPSNTKGGDLGYFQRGQMVKPFEDAAYSMEPGQVSEVVETNFGYHIIKVVDKKEASTATFEEVKSQIADHLKQEKTKVAVQEYITKLKTGATIKKTL